MQAAAEFEVVALLADSGALGLVTGQVEIIDIDGGGLQLILESHALLLGIDLVDRNLSRSRNGCEQKGRQCEDREKMFHSEAILLIFNVQIYEFIYKILNFV